MRFDKAKIFDGKLLLGYVSKVTQNYVLLNTPNYYQLSHYHYNGEDYHGGLLYSYVFIEGDNYGFLGQISEIEFLEKERREVTNESFDAEPYTYDSKKDLELNPKVKVALLLAFDNITFKPKRISVHFPNVGARVFLASERYVGEFLKGLFQKESGSTGNNSKKYKIGHILGKERTDIEIALDKLFYRHCAIVGTTGSGKSWTAAKLIELLIMEGKKVIVLDPTGEYSKAFKDIQKNVQILEIGKNAVIDYHNFTYEDLFFLAEPSQGIQVPILIDAVNDLKIVGYLKQNTALKKDYEDFISKDNLLVKQKKSKEKYFQLKEMYESYDSSDTLENVDITNLPKQIENECVIDRGDKFGDKDTKLLGYCLAMILRLKSVVESSAFKTIFVSGKNQQRVGEDKQAENSDVLNTIQNFIQSDKPENLIINLKSVVSEFQFKEIAVEVIGRKIFEIARNLLSDNKNGIYIFLDEAHNFLKRESENETRRYKYKAFELIAKELRKKNVSLVIITQRPSDIPDGVLSQFGTFIIHNLTNPNDIEKIRNVVERSDMALGLLPYLDVGEAVISSVNLPLVLPVKFYEPECKPKIFEN
ncbi:MAG: ATP-binding protein [Fervidobacterium sp.]|uniref:ATP-binding protein n=1 Tax=Fervidobacterium sp. TaxID=1871331 RepID=UPI0025BBB505|nr:ATP-binding protein [Fervidobacterium sp.]NPU88337.1 ATP-binding protein [Fervidobacterium sp.]